MIKRELALSRIVTTPPSRRRVKVAVLIGVIAGILGGIVKLGLEVPFPPLTADREPPPAIFLEKLGIHVKDLTYGYSRFRLNWANFLVHFSFSTVCAIFYVVVAEYNPRIKFLQGAAFGIVVWVVAHLLILPILGLTPATRRLPFEENLSECFGHAVWMWSIETVRRDLRSRITHEPDAEVPRLPPAPATSVSSLRRHRPVAL